MLGDLLCLKVDLGEHMASSVFVSAACALLCILHTNLKLSLNSEKYLGHNIDTFGMSARLKFLLSSGVEAKLPYKDNYEMTDCLRGDTLNWQTDF